MTLGTITLKEIPPSRRRSSFEFACPTRQRYQSLQKHLPFGLVRYSGRRRIGSHRLYVRGRFLDAAVDQPRYTFHDETNQVDVWQFRSMKAGDTSSATFSFHGQTFTARTLCGGKSTIY